MIKSYLGLAIIFAVQHQVSSLSANVDHRKHIQDLRKDMMKGLKDIQKKSEIAYNPIDNYDLIVTEPSKTVTRPVLRHRHHHHRRPGKGAKINIKKYNPQILQGANTLQNNNNMIRETNLTHIQEDHNATTTNYLNENRRGGEEEEATTQPQVDKDATTTNYNNENWRAGDKVATTSQNPDENNQKSTPVVPFYRRVNYLDDHQRNKPQKWVHCLDLVGPRLKGYKDNWHPKQLSYNDIDIRRISELLHTDVSEFNEEEIVSLLSQISELDLRIFQWDYTAITTILNVIIAGPTHSFKTLKASVKNMFDRWHLDISMMQTFLEQTRIFRPPCIDISGSAGNTKKAGGVRLFTKPDKPTKKHRGGHESCQSRERSTVNNHYY